jgi:hypothetical protein
MSAWAGRKVRRLVTITLQLKGTTCHLCGLPGADSADHDPPRSVLVASGVVDPDALVYLFPAHRYPCNIKRKARTITDQLRAELRAARLRYEGKADAIADTLSPRFARRRDFLRAGRTTEGNASLSLPGSPTKTGGERR